MFVRFKKDHEEWIYNAKKGAQIDVPNDYAQQLIERDIAVAVDSEKAINELYGEGNKPSKSKDS